jgi:hypothetical protein
MFVNFSNSVAACLYSVSWPCYFLYMTCAAQSSQVYVKTDEFKLMQSFDEHFSAIHLQNVISP